MVVGGVLAPLRCSQAAAALEWCVLHLGALEAPFWCTLPPFGAWRPFMGRSARVGPMG